MKDLMFDSFRQWRICMGAAIVKFLWGLSRMVLYTVTGMASIVRWLWRRVVVFVAGYPVAAIVAGVAICLVVWAATFVQGRAQLATAECQRDSLSYRLQQLMPDEGEDVSVGGIR